MWVNLSTGFYSVVHKPPCKKDELMVRAHSKVYIDELHQLLKTKYRFDGIILDTPDTDYAYRMIVPKKTLASFMAVAVNDLVSQSFKNTKSWEATYTWQRRLASEA